MHNFYGDLKFLLFLELNLNVKGYNDLLFIKAKEAEISK
jgi:hypothetical protein